MLFTLAARGGPASHFFGPSVCHVFGPLWAGPLFTCTVCDQVVQLARQSYIEMKQPAFVCVSIHGDMDTLQREEHQT